MLFEEYREEYPAKATKTARPSLPKGSDTNYEIGFLFNFVAGKSTRFDLEPVLLLQDSVVKYRRISIQVDKGLAYLQPLEDKLYQDFVQFSDQNMMRWMNATGNRFLRGSGNVSWSHTTSKVLVNLRKHYVELLEALWPTLQKWPHLFIHQHGKLNASVLPQSVKLGATPAIFNFKLDVRGQDIVLRLVLTLGGQEVPVIRTGGFLFFHDNTLYLPPSAAALDLLDLFKVGTITFPLSERKQVIEQYVLPYFNEYSFEISEAFRLQIVSPEVSSRIQLSELNESNLMIRPEFLYDDVVVEYDKADEVVAEGADHVKIVKRDKKREEELFEFLRALHATFDRQRNKHFFYLPFDEVMRKEWFLKMLRKVQQAGYSVHGFERLQKFRYSTHEPKFNIKATSKKDNYVLKISVSWGEQEISLKEIRQIILNGQDTIMLDDGTLGHIPESWMHQYSVLLRTGTEENGTLLVSKMHFGLLEDLLDKFDAKSRQEIEDRKKQLLEFDSVEHAPLSQQIKASLRPYQLSGLNWLQSLDTLGWGGCLADDMGLGKTLQTISFLQYLKEKYPGSTQLVVCPTSLIFNWENELQKFCPTMKFHTYYGLQRTFDKTHFEEFDVVLTSYGMVRNDQEVLSDFLWQYIILDESQAIKNPDAQVTKALKKIRSVNRTIISGTPVQNNTFDLYAQFNFLNPGLLGSKEFFSREFVQTIDKLGSKEKTQQLRKLIYPFTLRRTKEQVATDLPDKTVTVLWCSMEPEQRRVYNEYRDRYRKKILKQIDEEGIGKSSMAVLEGLLRLRQICDHPTLANKKDPSTQPSVKIEELIREVQENAGHHKVLIFSQFTEMLHLIRDNFDATSVPYCYLDGSTSLVKRKEQVEKFQSDEGIKAFLISLKAGGVGLNLTVADYVYIVDPWWNPAAEQQAIDRAHRIGQTRKVFAYKMICKDSVEEKILQLQDRKRALAEDLIQEDSALVKNLSREDVDFLFG